MPPSDPGSFFDYLGQLGVRLSLIDGTRKIGYVANSRRLDEFPGLLLAIFSDYANGLTIPKLEDPLRMNHAAPIGFPA